MANEDCPVCQTKLSPGLQAWHRLCKNCGYEQAHLQATINSQSAHQLIDETAREAGLRELRAGNFKELLEKIQSLTPGGRRLLDVGCAHGWFLDIAKNQFDVVGLEPDQAIFDATSRRGLPVRMGYFPDALREGEKFDVIVFNDVIEHIPNIRSILASCHQHLDDGGLLVLNLPNSAGLFYRLSKILCRFGSAGFFERLWQKDLPSPHLHYFNPSNLVSLLTQCGFDETASGSLPALRLAGLYERISYTGNLGRMGCALVFLGAALMLPLLNILPSDIIYVIAAKKPASAR